MISIRALNLPVGYRFSPTDEELINHYLKPKMAGRDSQVIAQIDLCKYEPCQLPAVSIMDSDDPVWFFFCAPDYKYSNSHRKNRATQDGYWKATGKERQIKARGTKTVIGQKRSVVFHYKVRNPGKPNWVINEYSSGVERAFVLCRLEKKWDEENIPNGDEGDPGSNLVSDFENQAVHDTIPEVHSNPEANLESPLSQQQLDYYFSTLQSPAYTEQGMNLSFANGSSYDFYGMEVEPSFEVNEPEEDPTEFVNSVLAEQDEYYCDETILTLLNDTSPPCSINMSQYVDGGVSSDTDNDALHGRRSRNSGSFLEEPVGVKYRQMRMVRTPCGTSKPEQSRKDNNVSLHNQFSMKGASSVSLNPDSFLSQKCSITESQGRSVDVTTCAGVASRRIQPQRPTTAVSGDKASQSSAVDLPLKEKSGEESKDDRKTIQNKSASDESSGINWKGYFIFVEAFSPVRSTPSPPSVYLFNALIGMFLFFVFVRELFLYGNWC